MTELIERYVGATLRTIPERKRADIEAELRASIADAVEARISTGEDSDAAEKKVLIELGDPDRLAASYAGHPGHLIGPDLFFDYRRLLTAMLITVVPVVMAVIGAVEMISGGSIGSIFGRAFGVALSLVVHLGFWTTLAFYFLEQSGGRVSTDWTPSRLPPRPSAGSIKLSETIASVVALVLAIAAILVARTTSPFITPAGDAIPMFEPSMWDFWLPYLIGVLAAEILVELVKYRIGAWTWGLASVNLAINGLFVIPAAYLLATDRLFNPDFLAEIPSSAVEADWVILVLVVLAGVVDVISGFRRAYLAR